MRKMRVFISIVLMFTLTSCATIIHGTRQDIHVRSNPSGAVVRINGTAVTTPGILTLNRRQKYHTLIFEKEGFDYTVEVDLKRTLDGWVFGNIIFGGLIGLAIDFVTGSAFKVTPGDIDIDFHEYQDSAKWLENKKDIIVFVDMEDLKKRGVKVENLERIL